MATFPTNDRGDGGFTILEVLVALLIVMLAITSFSDPIRIATTRMQRAKFQDFARLQSVSILSDLEKNFPLSGHEYRGNLADGGSYIIQIAPSEMGRKSESGDPLRAYAVKITFSSHKSLGDAFELNTIILAVSR